MSSEKALLDNGSLETSVILGSLFQLETGSCWCLLKNKSTFQTSSGNPDSSRLCTGWLGHARGVEGKSRPGGGWDGTLDQRETPWTSLHSSICSNYSLVPSCQFVIAASYTFLSTLALSWSLLLLRRVGKISPCACSQSVCLNWGALEVCVWRCGKIAGLTVWRCVVIIIGLYSSSASSEWVFSADNFNYT